MLGAWNPTSPGGVWAEGNAEIAKLYAGQFVVAVPGQLVAAGPDEEQVRTAAAEKLNLPVNDVMVAYICRPEERVTINWYGSCPGFH